MRSKNLTWSNVPLGSIAKFRAGSVFKTEHQGGQIGEIPFIKVSDFSLPENSFQIRRANNWVSRAKASEMKAIVHPPGATVFAKIGVALTYNRRRLLVRDTAIDNNLMSAAPVGGKVSPEFLYFLLSYLDFNAIANGSALPYLNVGDLQRIEVWLPPREIQEDIAGTLMPLQERIDLLRQTNATLESIAQALFKSWFIDFDPVRAKAEGREPEGMDAATAALFPAEFEESALGLIPKGWRAGTLADLSALNAKSWTVRRAPAEVLYVDLAGVKANVFEPLQRYSFAQAPSRARRELRASDTLVGTVRPGNRSFGFIAENEQGLTGSTGFAVLSPSEPEAAAFVYLCATRDENIERLAALADGGAYPAVRPELVHGTSCALPSASLLEAFHCVASPLLLCIAANTRRARALADLRDTLLPRLISGKLRLPKTQTHLEGAAA